jgi:glycine/D-amino acid oxidase-like deaminating enzyme
VNPDTVIVGAGKFGRVIANTIRHYLPQHKILLVDDAQPLAATKCSGGLIYPPWVTMMSRGTMEEGLRLLEHIYGLEKIELMFEGAKPRKVEAYHVPIDKVMDDPRLAIYHSKVVRVEPYGVVTTGNVEISARNVIVTAGAWCGELVKVPGLYGKRGVSFVWPGQVEGFIRPWAPYKQIVAHKHNDNQFWAGDGTAIITENWTEERQTATEQRVSKAVNRQVHHAIIQQGIRPVITGVTGNKPCYFKQLKNGIIIATGAGKSGMIASAWAAQKVMKVLKP